MLKIKFIDDVKDNENFCFDANELFMRTKIKGDDTERKILREIENAEYKDANTVIDRFGDNLLIDYISTGCKIALAVYNNPNVICNAIEAGMDALSVIVQCCKDGEIAVYNDNYIFWDLDIDKNAEIDVLFDNIHFDNLDELNEYAKERV